MNNQLLKTILIGALLGAALFFLPFFILKVFVIFLLFGIFFRFFGRHRGYRGYRGPWGWAYADKIRNMSDEEYATFKERMSRGRCGYHENADDQQKTEEA